MIASCSTMPLIPSEVEGCRSAARNVSTSLGMSGGSGTLGPVGRLMDYVAPEVSMATSLSKGDAVSWKSHGGTAHGKVVRKLIEPTDLKGHHVAASKDNPEYLVETDDGKQAAHKAEALTKGK
jgi:hypothetical protein